MPADRKRDTRQDEAVRETFPASDPPASMASGAARAVPPGEMLDRPGPGVPGAVALHRRFPDGDAAKLALESLVRQGPVDRAAAEIQHADGGAELRLAVPAEDAERIRALLTKA
ncbi:hypothetical protein [Falsiroseomonas bella]|nr:hypothetical protein [Falsiroseomonas bella]